MRLAILSDIHGNLAALEAVLADLKTRAPDVIVNLGDCVTSPLWPRETFELLSTLNWQTVRGNHDRWIAEGPFTRGGSVRFAHDALLPQQREHLGALPPSIVLDGNVLAVHGSLTSDTEYLLEDHVNGRLVGVTQAELGRRLSDTRASLVLCGHSHKSGMAYAVESRTVLNPGSVGCPRYADNANPFEAEYGSPHAHYAIASQRASRWHVEFIALDYDWEVVRQQASRNSRSDWALGFLAHEHDESGTS